MAISKLIKEYVYDKTTGSASKAVVSESILSQLPGGRMDPPMFTGTFCSLRS